MGWTVRFKSLNGTDCRVDVNGGGSERMAAANPVSWSEDKSDNLLDIIRSKSGNLNLIETETGEIDDLVPDLNTTDTVRIWYGTRLVFAGFLQAQSFDSPWRDGAKVVSIPFQSPLGTIGERNINIIKTAGNTQLEILMAEICAAMGYTRIVIPATLAEYTSGNVICPLELYVNNRVVCPLSSNFDFGRNDLFEPLTYLDILEGICNLYGLIAHDATDADGNVVLCFSKYDYTGDYAVLTLGNGQFRHGTVSQDTLEFSELFTAADDKGAYSSVMPIGRLDIDSGDYMDVVDMDLTLATLGGVNSQIPYLQPIPQSEGGEFKSDLFSESTIWYSDARHQYAQLGNSVRTPGDGRQEVIDICFKNWDGSAFAPVTTLFEYEFAHIPRRDFYIVMTMKNGNDGGMRYNARVSSGGKFLDWSGSSPAWVTANTIQELHWDTLAGNEGFMIGNPEIFHGGIPKTNYPIKIEIMSCHFGSNQFYWGNPVTGLSLREYVGGLEKYFLETPDPVRTIKQGGSKISDSISLLFNDSIDNDGRVIGGSLIAQPDYSYLFRRQKVLTVKVRQFAGGITEGMYKDIFTVNGFGSWRLIAVGEDPWDDTQTLMFMQP